MKAEVLAIIANNEPAIATKFIKAVLKSTVDYSPIVADKRQLAEVVENVDKLSNEAIVALVKALHEKMLTTSFLK